MGNCPSCGRFVGPYSRCPYCGADVGQRLAVRIFRYASLVVGVLGLAVLLLVARRSQVPAVEIGGLRGTMNWAYVRLEGVVTRQPGYDAEAQTLQFWLGDGTGEIMVMAYRPEAEWLLEEGLVPVMGDRITLEGTLRVKEDFQYLVLDVPQHTQIQLVEPLEMPIADVDLDLLYQKVTVRGVIRGDRTPYEGLRVLTLRDATGQIDVTLEGSGELPGLTAGQPVQVTGAVDQYQGTAQISVGRQSDLVVLNEPIPIAPARHIGDLSAADVGMMVQVEGAIASVQSFSAGIRYSLDDGTGTVTLLLWQDLGDAVPDRDALLQGATVRAVGKVAEYRGELEIVPELPSDVALVLTAARIVPERRSGELTAADVGQLVCVQGVLKSLRTFSAGVRGQLDDGTGPVTLLLWQEVYEELTDLAAVVPGAVLRVEGEVSEYRGELEVVPLGPAGVTVLGRVELPREERAIGQVTTDDVGQILQLAGRVTSTTAFSQGVRCTLDDGTGTITLLVWQEVLDQVEDPDVLVEGAYLSVRGEIDEYRGQLEIVPQVPADLEVTLVTPTPTPEPTAAATPMPESTAVPTLIPAPEAAKQPTPVPTAQPSPTLETRPIGSITGADVGGTFTIARAGIAGLDYFSQGVRYTLSDGSGSIILLVWQNVMEQIPARYELVPGSQVRVSGEIEEYQGDLEIIPQQGADVIVLAPAERPPIEERPIGQITPSDEGRIFTVEGRVTRSEGRGWLRLWLSDGTGEILIFVPTRTVEYLPTGIGVGVRIRVTGEVDIYQGVLEIIPLAGADVEVR